MSIKKGNSNTGTIIFEENQFLIDLIQKTDFANKNKSEKEYVKLLSTVGVKAHHIEKDSISQTMTKMKNKLINGIPHYYLMLVKHIKRYKKMYASTLKLVQTE